MNNGYIATEGVFKGKRLYHIYTIKNKINDKCYIGSAIDVTDRMRTHKKQLRENRHHSIKLQRAWNKYGEENFEFEIIDETTDKKRLIIDEQYWIDITKAATKLGYNVSPTAGSRLGAKCSAKTRKKISLNNAWRGKSSNRKGAVLSEETKEKLRRANLGKKLSFETRQKIGSASKGRKMPESAKIKIGLANKGRKPSPLAIHNRIRNNRIRKLLNILYGNI